MELRMFVEAQLDSFGGVIAAIERQISDDELRLRYRKGLLDAYTEVRSGLEEQFKVLTAAPNEGVRAVQIARSIAEVRGYIAEVRGYDEVVERLLDLEADLTNEGS